MLSFERKHNCKASENFVPKKKRKEIKGRPCEYGRYELLTLSGFLQ